MIAAEIQFHSDGLIQVPLSDPVEWPDVPTAMAANPSNPAGLRVGTALEHELDVDVRGNSPAVSFYVDYSPYGWVEAQFPASPLSILSVIGEKVATVALDVPLGRFMRIRIVPLPGNGPDTKVLLTVSGR